ncbi:MAG: efflux RND transporter periplasmic adaptor subunit, partial [Cyclobacteriaceae bacterium]|nr:efflux RND transporter periplasmic adaptor subunit [Cyclobacteriaceae bacterium SS2]
MKNKRIIIISSVLVGCLLVYFLLMGSSGSDETSIIVDVEKGEFIVEVAVTGELEAMNSVKITAPLNLRNHRVYDVTVQRIIPEGTVVNKGDFVAMLDQSDLNNRIQDRQLELQEEEAQYEQTQLDTTLQMREERDKLVNLRYEVQQAQLTLDQSQYEPPATIRQNEIALEKAQRTLEQAEEALKIRQQQNVAKMRAAATDVFKDRRELEAMQNVSKEMRIVAPESGMVIYTKNWDGRPIKEGSQVSIWRGGVVAELPDLSEMNSVTYVNEVDIRKIKTGQTVRIGLDAFPDKKLTGEVTKVANVGMQRPNSDAKVFEVMIKVNEVDGTMRPGMTTSNTIITNQFEDVVFVPLEALHNFGDSVSFVFVSDGINYRRQEVKVGHTNADAAIIELGLDDSDRVYLSMPSNETKLSSISLLEELEGKR